jgi:hypothetical protein
MRLATACRPSGNCSPSSPDLPPSDNPPCSAGRFEAGQGACLAAGFEASLRCRPSCLPVWDGVGHHRVVCRLGRASVLVLVRDRVRARILRVALKHRETTRARDHFAIAILRLAATGHVSSLLPYRLDTSRPSFRTNRTRLVLTWAILPADVMNFCASATASFVVLQTTEGLT